RNGFFEKLRLERHGYILATIHRAENTDSPARLRSVFEGLAGASATLPVVLPLHPRTRAALERERLLDSYSRSLHLLPPLGDLDMIQREKPARLIGTGCGRGQKEAFFCGVPCLYLPDETEWVELVQLGWNRLGPPSDPQTITDSLRGAL